MLGHPHLSIVRQCGLLSISRSGFCSTPTGESEANLALMRLIDAQFLEPPFYGARQMVRHLRRMGHEVGRKRIRRLMRRMGLAAVYQRPRTSTSHPDHPIYPYLLRDLAIERPNQVWCADITLDPLRGSSPMRRGFLYLVAVMDWASRKVLAWRLSNTLEPRSGSRRTSALKRWSRRSGGSACRTSLTRTRAASSPARASRRC